MKVALIVAIGKNREIGKNNDLLWHLPRDMRFFKETTVGHAVVMGRKNWDSIPKRFRPLTDRRNILLTRNTSFQVDGAEVVHTIDEAYALCHKNKETCFIIGGAQVYDLALNSGKVEELFITHVDESFDADTFFPVIDLEDWNQAELFSQAKDEKHPHAFVVKHYWKK